MTDFEALYYFLFNAITDACEQLAANQPLRALDILETAQGKAENAYVESSPEMAAPPAATMRLRGTVEDMLRKGRRKPDL